LPKEESEGMPGACRESTTPERRRRISEMRLNCGEHRCS
ncbi:MAG: hypothetical protein ACI9MR_001225, partial [Myxococcota bacterium]